MLTELRKKSLTFQLKRKVHPLQDCELGERPHQGCGGERGQIGSESLHLDVEMFIFALF